nr:hypothetical protein [uncultured Pseudomonas sp.]
MNEPTLIANALEAEAQQEAEHGMEAGPGKRRIDAQCRKHVPPALAEYAFEKMVGCDAIGEVIAEDIVRDRVQTVAEASAEPERDALGEYSIGGFERLRAEVERGKQQFDCMQIQRDHHSTLANALRHSLVAETQRADTAERKLAERDAMLRRARQFVEDWDDDSQEWMDLCGDIDNALLSESAEPVREVWLGTEELPERKIGACYRMILDDTPQNCVEIGMDNTNKRWFRGELNGAYPIDEAQAWLPAKPAKPPLVECGHAACESLGEPHPFCDFVRSIEANKND